MEFMDATRSREEQDAPSAARMYPLLETSYKALH